MDIYLFFPFPWLLFPFFPLPFLFSNSLLPPPCFLDLCLRNKDPKNKEEGGENSKTEKAKEKRDKAAKGREKKGKYPTFPHCKKNNHFENYCWYRPNVKCKVFNRQRHVARECKNKAEKDKHAQLIENQDSSDELLFVASCSTHEGDGSS